MQQLAEMGCRRRSCCFLPLICTLFLIPGALGRVSGGGKREDLKIGVWIGGGGSPPSTGGGPPSSEDLPPCAFPNMQLYKAYKVIQRFKKTIASDSKGIIDTWKGPNICNNDGRGYKGFYCEVPPDRRKMKGNFTTVASVDFNGFKLFASSVGSFVDQLPDLALFHANSNAFNGTLPDFTRLKFFYELDVSNNGLTGGFPTTVLGLNVSFLDLRYNGYDGTVPPAVFRIPTQVLFLNNNKFRGSIPSNLGDTRANYITFAFNFFTGPIPSSIGKLSNTLFEILFLGNQLSGCLPYEIGLLKKATVFDAGTNRLTGPIPLSFGCLQKIEQLNLAGNLLTGEVPDEVCRLGVQGRLMSLSLSDNYFTSVGLSCWPLIDCGKLDLRKNCILGLPEQRSLEECAEFLLQPPEVCPNACTEPCNPHWGAEQLDSKAAAVGEPSEDGARDGNTSSGYTTYKALQPPEKKNP